MSVIVAAIDESPLTASVLDRAVEQARWRGAQLHVAHVYHPPPSVFGVEGAYIFDDGEAAQAEHDRVWERARQNLAETGIEWVRTDLRGYPPQEIAAYARGVEARLIVVGTRGRGELSSLVLGSTSHGVIHDGPCDVLVVHSGGDA